MKREKKLNFKRMWILKDISGHYNAIFYDKNSEIIDVIDISDQINEILSEECDKIVITKLSRLAGAI